MTRSQEERLREIRDRYGDAVAAWCREKAAVEGEVPSEGRISKRMAPAEPAVPAQARRTA